MFKSATDLKCGSCDKTVPMRQFEYHLKKCESDFDTTRLQVFCTDVNENSVVRFNVQMHNRGWSIKTSLDKVIQAVMTLEQDYPKVGPFKDNFGVMPRFKQITKLNDSDKQTIIGRVFQELTQFEVLAKDTAFNELLEINYHLSSDENMSRPIRKPLQVKSQTNQVMNFWSRTER